MSEGRILVAKDSFVALVKGVEYTVHGGVTRIREGHPLQKAMPEAFEPLTVHFEVEQATAAPGEKRQR
jgi:hypothetical protein